MQYLRARYYTPETGSFITKDTYPGTLTNALSQNSYTYVHNNPINNIDPSGHKAKDSNGSGKGGTAGKGDTPGKGGTGKNEEKPQPTPPNSNDGQKGTPSTGKDNNGNSDKGGGSGKGNSNENKNPTAPPKDPSPAATNPDASNTVPPVTLETVIAESFTDAITAAMNFLASKGCNESEDRIQEQEETQQESLLNKILRKLHGWADDYTTEERKWINCYGYAFGLETSYNPGTFSINPENPEVMFQNTNMHSVEEIAAFVLRDSDEWDKNGQGPHIELFDGSADLKEGQYIVVLRTSSQIHPKTGRADYHFARQLSDGTWADKPGTSSSRCGAIDGDVGGWDSGEIEGYYDSEPIYFVVTPR